MKVAFQGERGAYSEAAAIAYYQQTTGQTVEPVPCTSFEEVFQHVEQGQATEALLPVENSLAGSIHRNYDLLQRHSLHIVGEHALRVEHCLMALEGVNLTDIHQVLSHPQALAQCESYLDKLGAARIASYDTAGSARRIREQNLTDSAAIASKRAAQVWGLQILAEGIEDTSDNHTRFVCLNKQARQPPTDKPARTSIVFSLINQPGILFKALSVFALRDIDLLRIESRPHRQERWRYIFYLDFADRADSEPALNAMRHLEEIAPMMRILGSYENRTSLSKPSK